MLCDLKIVLQCGGSNKMYKNQIRILVGVYSPRVPVVAKTDTCTRPIRGKRVLVSANAQPADAGPRVPVPTSAGWATRAKLYGDGMPPEPWRCCNAWLAGADG